MAAKESGFQNADELLGGSYGLMNSAPGRHGVYTNEPAASRKYSSEYGTMARLAVPVSAKAYEAIVDMVSKGNSDLEPLARSLYNGFTYYIDFLLQSAQEAVAEKVQIVDTLSDNYIAYFFGQSPPTFRYSGLLLNTWQDDWRSAFMLIYQEILRGTKLARRTQLVNLQYDQQVVVGYLTDHSQVLTSDTQMAAQFTFSLLVKSLRLYRLPKSKPSLVYPLGSLLGEGKVPGIKPEPVGGLYVSPVKRSFRQIGTPKCQSDARQKETNQDPATSLSLDTSPLSGGDPSKTTPADKQAKQNIQNLESAAKSLGPAGHF